jgi:hypothetical protein
MSISSQLLEWASNDMIACVLFVERVGQLICFHGLIIRLALASNWWALFSFEDVLESFQKDGAQGIAAATVLPEARRQSIMESHVRFESGPAHESVDSFECSLLIKTRRVVQQSSHIVMIIITFTYQERRGNARGLSNKHIYNGKFTHTFVENSSTNNRHFRDNSSLINRRLIDVSSTFHRRFVGFDLCTSS